MQASRWFGLAARVAFGVFAAAGLTSCGSGAVSGPVAVNDPSKITVVPAPATLYSGLPTTFTITGGTGSYIVGSSNQSIIPVSGAIAGATLTIIPNNVTADTAVTLNVRDTGSTPAVSAELTVKPGTVSNAITITPTATQGSCSPAVCSAGDAFVSATLSQAGQPLGNRAVRFEVVSGDFRFITSSPASSTEITDFTTTVPTDDSGRATARLRVTAGAANQTGVLRVVDVATGAFQVASFNIAQFTGTSPGFFATPSTLAFIGPNNQQCASGATGTVLVFGGVPPYTVTSGTSAFQVGPSFVGASGGSFTVVANGICTSGTTITIADSASHTTSVTATNALGTTAVPPLIVSPSAVSLTQCSSVATVSVAGGAGQYIASSSSSALLVNLSGNTVTVSRNPGIAAPTSATVTVTSGNAQASFVVNISGDALGTCSAGSFQVTPNNVTLAGCNPVNVVVTGGTPPYSAQSNNSSVTLTSTGVGNPYLQIFRTPGTANFAPPAIVTVTDATRTSTKLVTVDGTGAGLGQCP